MKIKHTTREPGQYKGDMLAYFVYQEDKKMPVCDDRYVQEGIKPAFRAGDFSGREGETLLLYPAGRKKPPAKRILVVGLGRKEKEGKNNGAHDSDVWRDKYRRAAGTVSRSALKTRAEKIMVAVPPSFILDTPEC